MVGSKLLLQVILGIIITVPLITDNLSYNATDTDNFFVNILDAVMLLQYLSLMRILIKSFVFFKLLHRFVYLACL